ncbi:MAG: DUF4179 domain-containing protein [Parasporobacterium sp.]|nr:DUF4179 domain-containing protein [Parasporobacterium sp.]
MTNKEKYKQAFSAVKPSGEINLEVEKMRKSNHGSWRSVAVAAACCCLVIGGGVTVYANDVGGIQRTVQVWINGDQTDAVFNYDQKEGTYSLDYTDATGEEKHRGGGGVAINPDGTERPLTEEELWDELNAPDVEYKEDGSVWLYYLDQKMDITDKFKDDVCYVQLIRDGKPWYMTIKYQNGYGASPHKYMSPAEFN